jgi:hypothetical protein
MKRLFLTSVAALFLAMGTTHVLLAQYRDDPFDRLQNHLQQQQELDRIQSEQRRMRNEMEYERTQQRNKMERLRIEQDKLRWEQEHNVR